MYPRRAAQTLRDDETTRGRIVGHGLKNVTKRYARTTMERRHAALTAFEKLVFAALEQSEEGR